MIPMSILNHSMMPLYVFHICNLRCVMQAVDDPNAPMLDGIASNSLIGTGELIVAVSYYTLEGLHVGSQRVKDAPGELPTLKANVVQVKSWLQELTADRALPAGGKGLELDKETYHLSLKKVGTLLQGDLEEKKGAINGAATLLPPLGILCTMSTKYLFLALYKKSDVLSAGTSIEEKMDTNTASTIELLQAITKDLSAQGK